MAIQFKEKNYTPTTIYFTRSMLSEAKDVGYQMIADVENVCVVINSLVMVGKKISHAILGLDGDFMNCYSIVYNNGLYHPYKAHDNSCWAEPVLIVYYRNGDNDAFSCWYREVDIYSDDYLLSALN